MDVLGMSADLAWTDGAASRHDPLLPEDAPSLYRRLSDKVLFVFHHACDSSDLEAADSLLGLLETMTLRGPRPETGNRRLNVDSLVNAHERLWRLKNPGRC